MKLAVLAVDWERLRRVYPGRDDARLAEEALARGREIVRGPLEDPPPTDLPALERLPRLRRRLARRAASVGVYRYEYAKVRSRLATSVRAEQQAYEARLELDRALVPLLKEEARALRAEVRRLESELRARGFDPEAVEPRIDWPSTLAVDDYERPKYESVEERRRRAVEFFRRLGSA